MAALVVGFARGISIVLAEGQIMDTIVHGAASALDQVPRYVAAIGMLGFQSTLNLLIPSGSGQAAVTMPLMAPLSDILGITRQTAVFAFTCGDGFSNSVIPTSGILMAMLIIQIFPSFSAMVAIYTLLGVIVSVSNVGPNAANALSTHWIPNLIFFALFIVFAFSFFGMFELVLPSSWSNKADGTKAIMGNRGTYKGAFSGDNYKKSYTLLFHAPDDTWEGNVAYGDNHVTLERSVMPDNVQYECGNINLKKDNIFAFQEFAACNAGLSTGGDSWMCMGIGAPNATTYAEAPEKLTDGTNPT